MKYLGILFVLLLLNSCDTSPSCASATCLLTKKWILKEYHIDNVVQVNDLSKYSINFTKPDRFSRTGINNSADEGSWQLKNDDKTLVLTSGSLPIEEYIVSSLTDKSLVLVTIVTDSKTGNKQHKLTLTPF
jgi:hypothetical protein